MIKWKINSLKLQDQQGEFKNVVFAAEWSAKYTEEELSSDTSGVCCFAPPSENFVIFENLKEDVVLRWCWDAGINKNEIELFLQNNLLSQKTLAMKQVNVPWF
jgi:hypothetical protein